MLFSDPLSSSLFFQSLSPDLQQSLLIFPSSPTTTMSAPSFALCSSSRAVRRASATATATNDNAAAAVMSESAESELFPFLDTKPSAMIGLDAERRGGGQGCRGAKGRRHAGEAILRRKLANQAFLIRVGGGGAGGKGHGTRRGRVLSEMVADEFAPSVPYSLNRKSRWTRQGAEWLSGWASSVGVDGGQRVRLSLAEADYSLGNGKSLRALHSWDGSKGDSATVESRWAKSSRGALLPDLQVPTGQENEAPASPVDDLHFQLSRPHPVARVFAAKFFKRRQPMRGGTRRSLMETSVSQMGRAAATRTTASTPAVKGPVHESEPEEESDFTAQYRPKREETYSLADFVKETSIPPLMVRRPTKAEQQSEEEFAMVDCCALIDELPDSPSSLPCPSSTCPSPPIAFSLLCRLNQNQSDDASVGLFLRVPFSVCPADLGALAQLRQQKREWVMSWLEGKSGRGVLALDLSRALTLAKTAQEPDEPILVVLLDGQEMVINALFPSEKANMQLARPAISEGNVEGRIAALVETLRADFADWLAKRDLRRFAAQHQSAALEPLRAAFHSPRLAFGAHPVSVYTALAQQHAELAREDGQFVGAEELLARKKSSEEEEEEEFELIDMYELLDESERREAIQKECEGQLSKCADCGVAAKDCHPTMLRSCAHRLCIECLAKGVRTQLADNGGSTSKAKMHCPVCPSALPLDVLPLFVPLSVANSLALLHFAFSPNNNKALAECPACTSLLDLSVLGKTEKRPHLSCTRCQIHWCAQCQGAPHWPLSCAQNDEWSRKLEQQEQHQKESKGNTIAGPFAEICLEARARRIDVKLGWQLGKHMRRLGDAKLEKRFVLTRKTALHLLEFGTAWLYLTRQNPRPPHWVANKSLFWSLRDRVEFLDNDLLFSGSMSDAEGLKQRLAELEQLTEKAMVAKF